MTLAGIGLILNFVGGLLMAYGSQLGFYWLQQMTNGLALTTEAMAGRGPVPVFVGWEKNPIMARAKWLSLAGFALLLAGFAIQLAAGEKWFGAK
jgi:hypothetical protein